MSNVGTDLPGPTSSAARPASRRRTVGALLFGVAAFLLLESADAFIATPLRELSSALVKFLLSALGFPVSRQGTILATPRMRFDVVPACSGSTTLKVLLFVAIFWCGLHPRLTAGRRAVAILLAIPLALAANVLRVSVLVVVGDYLREEPGEFFHVLTGVVAFVLAMSACFLTTDRLAEGSTPAAAASPRKKWMLLAGLVTFLYAPFLIWCFENWKGGAALDEFGWAFTLPASAWIIWRWRSAPVDATRERWGVAGFGASLVLLGVATLTDVNVLKGISLLATSASLALAHRGPRFAGALLPILAMAYLGFPTASYQIQKVTLPLLSVGAAGAILSIKAGAAALLAASTRLTMLRQSRDPVSQPSGGRLIVVEIIAAGLCAGFTGSLLATAAGASSPSRLEMSFIQSDWTGRNYRISPDEEEFFQGRIWSRRYRRGDLSVDVLVTSTGGDRHRAHPPTYCLTGSGWEPGATEAISRTVGSGAVIPMTRLRLGKLGRDISFAYWFTDGTDTLASYNDMLVQDMLARARGRRPDWFLFRVMTESGPNVLDEFLSQFQAKVVVARAP